jgi:hypothetical protein
MFKIALSFLILVFASFLIGCDNIVEPAPPISLTANSTEDLIVATSPLVLTVTTLRSGPGTVEFFGDEKSIGKVAVGTKWLDPGGYKFTLSAPIASASNGKHKYKAIFTFADKFIDGNPAQMTTGDLYVTIQLK